jgi:hypothetical protein
MSGKEAFFAETSHSFSSLTLRTGNIDRVYTFALTGLQETLGELFQEDAGYDDTATLLRMMIVKIAGKRMQDTVDLPLDLVV